MIHSSMRSILFDKHLPLDSGVRAKQEPKNRAKVRFHDITHKRKIKVTFIFGSSQQQFVVCLRGDRALNSAPNGIKSSMVIKSGDIAGDAMCCFIL